jgi:hypothetical protein
LLKPRFVKSWLHVWSLVVRQFDLTSDYFTGTAGVSPAERALARSILVNPYVVSYRFSSRYALAAGETPAVPVSKVDLYF